MAKNKKAPKARPDATLNRRKPSLDFSVTGLVYCSMMMFMGVAAINSQANLLFGVFGLMIGILLVSFTMTRIGLKKLKVTRIMPDHAIVGTPTTINYEVQNNKRFWPTVSVVVAELEGVEAFARQPQAYVLHAAPGMSARVPVAVLPKRRGVHFLDQFQLSTSFPFGFVKRAFDRGQRESILVFPAVGQVDPKLLQMARSAESSGPMMRPRRGGMDEFYGLKEFRTGESPRFIYWRRSARTGTLVSKEMTHVSPPRLMLLVDTYVKSAAENCVAVERCIAMAASLASHAISEGLPVGLLAWTGEWTALPSNRGKRHRRDLLTILARLPVNTEQPLPKLLESSYEYQTSATTMVLFTPGEFQMGLGESVRGKMLAITPSMPQVNRWFRFPDHVDFENCAPLEATGRS